MRDAWELLSSWPGGAVTTLASAHGSITVAATAAGLHSSTDGGQSWTWIRLGPDPVLESVVLSPDFASDGVVTLGTASGLFRSVDGGRVWRPLLSGSRVQCVAATDFGENGVVLAGTESDGILRSEDGGLDWSGANAGLLDLNVIALAISPVFGRDRTAFAGTASGLFRSRNGGRAWRLVELGPEAPVVQSLATSTSFADDGLVLAGTERDGLFRSEDGGQTWDPVAAFPEPCVTCLAFGPEGGAEAVVVAGTAAGIAISRDAGETWVLEAAEFGPILSVTVAQGDDGLAILAGTTGDGIVRLAPGATSWSPANRGLAGRATVGLVASTAYGAVPLLVVSSLDAGILLSHDGGQSWKSGHDGLVDVAASSAAIVETPGGKPSVIAAFAGGLYRSEGLEHGWRPVQMGADGPVEVSNLSLAGDTTRGSSTIVAAGKSTIALSTDGGVSWQSLPPPRPHADIVQVGVSPQVTRNRVVYAVTRATTVASDGSLEYDGLELWHSDDFGQHWSQWLHSPGASVISLAVPNPGTLDAAVLVGHAGRVARPLRSAREVRRGERRPLWQDAPVGKPGASVTAIALSPHVGRDGIVLAAADAGVSLSRDGGATFSAWDHGLDVPLITAVTLTAAADGGLTAYVLGLGGTLWRRAL